MSFLEFHIYSAALQQQTTVNVIMPQAPSSPVKVLYLLHGLSDDHTIWMRRTSIERYVEGKDLAVVMPDGGRSFYCDLPDGTGYWTYISEELPQIIQTTFNVSRKREDTFAAGLSMGGYGALKLAIRCPERFAAAAGLSSAVFRDFPLDTRGAMDEYDFGPQEKFATNPDNIFHAADVLSQSHSPRPRLLQICGTEDFLYNKNQAFRNHLKSLGIACEYREYPGSHTWGFWDCHIQETLTWMGL